jgi:hypothetical protein
MCSHLICNYTSHQIGADDNADSQSGGIRALLIVLVGFVSPCWIGMVFFNQSTCVMDQWNQQNWQASRCLPWHHEEVPRRSSRWSLAASSVGISWRRYRAPKLFGKCDISNSAATASGPFVGHGLKGTSFFWSWFTGEAPKHLSQFWHMKCIN